MCVTYASIHLTTDALSLLYHPPFLNPISVKFVSSKPFSSFINLFKVRPLVHLVVEWDPTTVDEEWDARAAVKVETHDSINECYRLDHQVK